MLTLSSSLSPSQCAHPGTARDLECEAPFWDVWDRVGGQADLSSLFAASPLTPTDLAILFHRAAVVVRASAESRRAVSSENGGGLQQQQREQQHVQSARAPRVNAATETFACLLRSTCAV